MSYRTDDLGCIGLFIISVLAIILLSCAVKCSISLVETIEHSRADDSSENQYEQRQESWTRFACKNYDGTVIKNPQYPEYYYDVRYTCKICAGTGKLLPGSVGQGFVADDRCPTCYGTRHERRRIPKDSF